LHFPGQSPFSSIWSLSGPVLKPTQRTQSLMASHLPEHSCKQNVVTNSSDVKPSRRCFHARTGLRGWRPLNGRPGLHVAVWLQARMCWLRLQPIGCTPALSEAQSATAVQCAACGTIQVLRLFYLLRFYRPGFIWSPIYRRSLSGRLRLYAAA